MEAARRVKAGFARRAAESIEEAPKTADGIRQAPTTPATTGKAPLRAPDKIKAALKPPDRIKAAFKAPDRIKAALKPPDRIKAALKPPDRIKAAFKAPDRIWQSLQAPEKTWKPRPITWRPAGVAAATTRPEARPPWSPDPERTPSSGARRYRPGLDGLRALAVVGVLLYHAGVHWVPGGFLGVDLFFVISGYLITSLLIAEVERTGGISYAVFCLKKKKKQHA